MSTTQHYLTPEQLCSCLPGITPRHLARWRWAGTGPAYAKLGQKILYPANAVDQLVERQPKTQKGQKR